MTHYALIGHPLGHSLSPQIHRALLAAAHLEGDYRLLDIAPEDLANRLPELQTLRGFNVTIPTSKRCCRLWQNWTKKRRSLGR